MTCRSPSAAGAALDGGVAAASGTGRGRSRRRTRTSPAPSPASRRRRRTGCRTARRPSSPRSPGAGACRPRSRRSASRTPGSTGGPVDPGVPRVRGGEDLHARPGSRRHRARLRPGRRPGSRRPPPTVAVTGRVPVRAVADGDAAAGTGTGGGRGRRCRAAGRRSRRGRRSRTPRSSRRPPGPGRPRSSRPHRRRHGRRHGRRHDGPGGASRASLCHRRPVTGQERTGRTGRRRLTDGEPPPDRSGRPGPWWCRSAPREHRRGEDDPAGDGREGRHEAEDEQSRPRPCAARGRPSETRTRAAPTTLMANAVQMSAGAAPRLPGGTMRAGTASATTSPTTQTATAPIVVASACRPADGGLGPVRRSRAACRPGALGRGCGGHGPPRSSTRAPLRDPARCRAGRAARVCGSVRAVQQVHRVVDAACPGARRGSGPPGRGRTRSGRRPRSRRGWRAPSGCRGCGGSSPGRPRTVPPRRGRTSGSARRNQPPNVDRVASLSMTNAVPPRRTTRPSSRRPGSQPGPKKYAQRAWTTSTLRVGQRHPLRGAGAGPRRCASARVRRRASATSGGCGSTPTTCRAAVANRGRWNPVPHPRSRTTPPAQSCTSRIAASRTPSGSTPRFSIS